jgi:hypothetical protein
MTILWLILLSILSGVLYRMGGKGGAWYYDTKARDIGCAITTSVAVFVVGVKAPWWIHLVCFLMLFGALTTYWDFLFGFDNHWFHGFVCGAAYLPYAFYGEPVSMIGRAFLLAILMGAWSLAVGNDVLEEFGRGFVLPITLALVFIL